MRRVQQKHSMGCSIACIAMLSNLSYKDILKLTNPNRWPWQSITPPNYDTIRNILIQLGVDPGEWTWQPILCSAINVPAIVCIKYSPTKIHAAVWNPETQIMLDPFYEPDYFETAYYEKLSVGYLPIFGYKPLTQSTK